MRFRIIFCLLIAMPLWGMKKSPFMFFEIGVATQFTPEETIAWWDNKNMDEGDILHALVTHFSPGEILGFRSVESGLKRVIAVKNLRYERFRKLIIIRKKNAASVNLLADEQALLSDFHYLEKIDLEYTAKVAALEELFAFTKPSSEDLNGTNEQK